LVIQHTKEGLHMVMVHSSGGQRVVTRGLVCLQVYRAGVNPDYPQGGRMSAIIDKIRVSLAHRSCV
jgi:hypothetical protein